MTITPTSAEVIVEAIESRLLDVHTALPGRVLSYDKDAQTVDVELQIQRMIPDASGALQIEKLPNLPSVMVGFPRNAKFFVSFPLVAGDFVFVIFSEASIDQWRSKGAATPPGDARRHTLTGACAVPMGYPNGQALTEAHASAMVAGQDGGQKVFIHDGGNVEVTDAASGSADDYVAQAGKVLAELDDVKTDLDGVKSTFDGHTHILAISALAGAGGTGTAAPPASPITPPHTPGSVASSNLKSDD